VRSTILALLVLSEYIAARRAAVDTAVARPMARGIAAIPPAAAAGTRRGAKEKLPNAAARACGGLRRPMT
jgi:hypothetical protein